MLKTEVIGEIAIALVLLASYGLFLRSFEKMREVDLGFRPDHTLIASYSLPQNNIQLRRKATPSTMNCFVGFHNSLG
jgi:hypothetical protein